MTARAGKTQKTTDKPPPTLRSPTIVDTGGVASVHLTLAVCDYEHVREIAQGLVRADGITLTPLIFPSIEEITFRFTNSLEWDVSELSFGKYISLTSQGIAPMVAIPVFPSRVHRHSAIYVRGKAGINEPGRAEKVELKLPAGIRYQARPDTSLSAMLASGEVDAVISARAPEGFARGGPVVRPYPNYRAEEGRFFRKTGIFPIMHLITMRRTVFEQHPWIAM